MTIAPDNDRLADRLVLTVHGQHWRGWTDVSVSRSIEAVAGAFDVTLTKRSGATLRFGPGDACRVEIESEDGAREPVLTGFIDDMEPSFDTESHSVTIRGRDAAGDLVDCSAIHPPSGEWHGATLYQIARDLVAPYGLSVSVAADVGGPFGTFRIEEGETVWACLERACRYRGVLAISDGLGGLVLTSADQAQPTGVTLARGRAGPGELIEAASVFSHRDRYSEIIVKGQSALDDDADVEAVAAGREVARDKGIRRHRPLIIQAEAGESLAERAYWERTVRYGRSHRAEITVVGWRDAAGRLWRPLTTARVAEPWLNLKEEMLIAGVTYERSNRGSTTRLELVGEGALDILREPPPASVGGGDSDLIWWTQ